MGFVTVCVRLGSHLSIDFSRTIRKMFELRPQATVSRWKFYHLIAARIRLPHRYEKNILEVPDKFNVGFSE